MNARCTKRAPWLVVIAAVCFFPLLVVVGVIIAACGHDPWTALKGLTEKGD